MQYFIFFLVPYKDGTLSLFINEFVHLLLLSAWYYPIKKDILSLLEVQPTGKHC